MCAGKRDSISWRVIEIGWSFSKCKRLVTADKIDFGVLVHRSIGYVLPATVIVCEFSPARN